MVSEEETGTGPRLTAGQLAALARYLIDRDRDADARLARDLAAAAPPRSLTELASWT